MAFKGNMKRRLAKADAQGARFAIIIGDDETRQGSLIVRR
jgi:histidyl-tRNA synthetase